MKYKNNKNEKLSNNSDFLDNKDINIYKNNLSSSSNINKIESEKDIKEKKEANKLLIISKNKFKQKKENIQNFDGRVNTPSLDFNKLKYHEDETVPSSMRKFRIKKNEDEDNIDENHNIQNKNHKDNKSEDENFKTLGTESDLLENEKEIINPNDLFKKIISIDLNVQINIEDIKMFLFNQVPKNEMIISNINIESNLENKGNNILYDYNLEIIRNNKIYYFAKIVKYFPQMKIKIYYSDNYNNINNNKHYSHPSSKEDNNDYNMIYAGKIISNMMRTNFVVYSGNKKNNYIKILNVNYSINFFGLLGVREMKVDKYIDDNISFSLFNFKPEWDYQYNNYKIDFNGRVKQASKKNFILIDINKSNNNKNKTIEENSEYRRILQCGKIDEKTYALDFIFPLTAFEAFCISITSLVTKISCE